jgi:PAS domain-containing protein
VARALAGEDVAEVEVHGVRKDNGSRFTALYRATPVFDDVGEVVWVVATMRDVTLRKRAEHILKESAGQFRTLADSIPQLAWMADATGWLFWYNRRWYDYTGTTLETMEGWGWRSVHHPAHVDRVEEGFRRCIEAESESGCAVTTASSST